MISSGSHGNDAASSPRRVFLTGASSGIGAALARHYAAAGATVALVARRRRELERLAQELPLPCEIYPADVRDAAGLVEAAGHFIGKHGHPDVVIANAGVSVGTLTDRAEDTAVFQEILDINVVGLVNTFQPFLAGLRERRAGTLAGIASVAGYRGLPGAGAYSASKAAAIAYLESLRLELRGSGVRVVTICPGFVDTPMTRVNPYPMPFLMRPETAAANIAAAIARGTRYTVVPWQMAVVARLLHVLPDWLYDALFARARHKPRRNAQS
jgi:short-subunit dehydrogenase